MSRKRVKQYLTVLLAIGVIAVVAGGTGTFASFTAVTTNPNNTFSTGTLFLHNTANGGTACTSESAASNSNASCDTLFSNISITPGTTKVAYLTLTNAGTLSASGIKFYTAGCTESTPSIATLNGAVSASGAISSTIAVNSLTQNLTAGTPIAVAGGTSETLTVASDTTSGSSTIPVTQTSWTNAHTDLAPITLDTSAFTSSPNLCGSLNFSIVEQDAANGSGATDKGCAWGTASGLSCDTTSSDFISSVSSNSSTPSSLTLVSNQNGNTGTALSPGKSRYLKLEVTAPSSLGNSAQNDQLTFSLSWQITAS